VPLKPLLKIQYGDVYIQLPSNDTDAFDLALDVLEFMKKWIQENRGKFKIKDFSLSSQMELANAKIMMFDDVKKVVEENCVGRAQLTKVTEELREMVNERSSGTIQGYDLIKEILERLEMLK